MEKRGDRSDRETHSEDESSDGYESHDSDDEGDWSNMSSDEEYEHPDFVEFLDSWEENFMDQNGTRGFSGDYENTSDMTHWSYRFNLELPNDLMKYGNLVYQWATFTNSLYKDQKSMTVACVVKAGQPNSAKVIEYDESFDSKQKIYSKDWKEFNQKSRIDNEYFRTTGHPVDYEFNKTYKTFEQMCTFDTSLSYREATK